MPSLAAVFEQSHSPLLDIDPDAPSSRAMAQYRHDPVGFAVKELGIPEYRLRWSLNRGFLDRITSRAIPGAYTKDGVAQTGWDGTSDPIAAMLEGLADELNVCVEAATGTQKSFTAAIAVLWFLACWDGAIVKTYAPGEAQLTAYMWKEIGQLWPAFKARFPQALLLNLEIRMRGGQDRSWGAMGVSVKIRAGEETAVGAHGAHAPHMLLIVEEGPGVEQSIYRALENTCTAPHNLRLAIGNPDHQLDTLHTFGFTPQGKPKQRMKCIRISAYDHPNVVCNDADIVPGAVSAISVESRREEYGEDGRLHKSRVRGMSPTEAADALIKLEWVRAAQARWVNKDDRTVLEAVGYGRRALGVDASNSEDGDQAAIARGKGAVLLEVDAFACPNANNLGFKVHLEMEEKGIDPDCVGVDGVGIGAGAVNELRKRDKYVRNLIGGAGAEGSLDEEDWNNLRSQILWTIREDLRKGSIAVPPDDEELATDLVTPTWRTFNGKIQVEKKEDIQKRLPHGRSPNKGDAAAYWNFVRPRDPVKSEQPKAPQTIAQRVMQDLQALDEPVRKKRYYGVMRQ